MSFAIAAITPMFTSCSSDDNNEEENYSPDGENSNNGKMLSGVIDGHEAVDLGLPSGTLWCKYNLGVD